MNLIPFLPRKPVPLSILGGPFRGARLILNPAHSKRKILGVYEHPLNPWLRRALQRASVIYDVGANDGYYTYGCAHVLKRHQGKGYVIAFEPTLLETPALKTPASWPQYRDIDFEFIPKFVGAVDDKQTVRLGTIYSERAPLHGVQSLVKVDVEGAEVEVLKGAGPLLGAEHHWVVEVHGNHLLAPVLKIFSEARREVTVHAPEAHWLFGPENRTIMTSWVTTNIPEI
jgi:hypothetical protein